ncbi:uncharacterized protein BP01DRAFT_352937 [Aspergillus saccharolyticus JOP 1030-1]|uniref:Fatty acid desaturase domain-containing protein n=1 Tax=Aspergillus saccharolyticus JOP 1030-1 TaxID=1450539 RepID=A0A318ZPF1_9EURO|nr:hypothetical protein BP01DRAFT_352937 [Aspergillus saccharolyticus JOP 1030-1]PYH49469.1 hypothetical protein BP01DRAFT_352937 [Aspergillus saccharolyticus JOP 1030-1]
MDPATYIDPNLTVPDRLVLEHLLKEAESPAAPKTPTNLSNPSQNEEEEQATALDAQAQLTLQHLESLNDPHNSSTFTPTVTVTWDLPELRRRVPAWLLQPYIQTARSLVRVETDVVMLTHLLLYFSTSVPSALYLFFGTFHWWHGLLHWLMQSYYVGTYTLMMHQHIHMGGILTRSSSSLITRVDSLFPYLLDPLMGHTWNSYYYHHVKHHHVEGNGPRDLSSTLRYQRDSPWDFACYVARFYFLVWCELPAYFLRRGQVVTALKAGLWELGSYAMLCLAWRYGGWRPTLFVLLLPLLQLRVGLMVGNWGQHAFVDEVDPDSDFRSSITLIDVASNRFCYNDGYHTSHHLNPRRHWRDHPVAFLRQHARYAAEHALVFRNIDYIMITVRLLRKDYRYLAKCLVPMGEQIAMTLDEKAEMLRRKTRQFSEEEIAKKFKTI